MEQEYAVATMKPDQKFQKYMCKTQIKKEKLGKQSNTSEKNIQKSVTGEEKVKKSKAYEGKVNIIL